MTINKAEAMATYRDLTAAIRKQDSEHVQVQGDVYTVTDSFTAQGSTGTFEVHEGSRIDNDPKTRDSVRAHRHGVNAEGATETYDFQHYSKKKLLFLDDERMTVTLTQGKQGQGAWFSLSSEIDFSV